MHIKIEDNKNTGKFTFEVENLSDIENLVNFILNKANSDKKANEIIQYIVYDKIEKNFVLIE